MELIRGLINLQQQSTACVATIGNFDGVHLGHQAIVNRVIEKAKSLDLASCVIIFEPHPKEFFMSASAPARLTCFNEKYTQLKMLGINKILVLQFNQSIGQMAAEDFVNHVLINKLKIAHLVVGDDFHFGHRRKGNYQLLESMAHSQYTLEPTPSVMIDGDRVSSTLVREALALNNLNKAKRLLNRRYSMSGKVGYGQQLGRTLDFPTANVAIKRKRMSVNGVFLVLCRWQQAGQKQQAWGAANCGARPTVQGVNYRLEVHLLGVSPALYGIELAVDFYAFIRAEKKFDNLGDLKLQISSDIDDARKLIAEIELKDEHRH